MGAAAFRLASPPDVKEAAGLKPAATLEEAEDASLKGGVTLKPGAQSKTCVSMLRAEPLNVGRIPMFVTERRLHVSPSMTVRVT